MDEVCENPSITSEETYNLSALLFEAAKLMYKLDVELSRQLLELASATLDRINSDRFTPEDMEEIDDISKEITGE